MSKDTPWCEYRVSTLCWALESTKRRWEFWCDANDALTLLWDNTWVLISFETWVSAWWKQVNEWVYHLCQKLIWVQNWVKAWGKAIRAKPKNTRDFNQISLNSKEIEEEIESLKLSCPWKTDHSGSTAIEKMKSSPRDN